MKKKIVIFGSSGNVGSYLTKYANEYFSNTQYEVVASGRRQTNVFDSYSVPYYSVDITNPNDFDKLPQDNVDAVMLLSATIPSYMSQYNPGKYLTTNTIGAFNVLEYCRRVNVRRVLYTQTVFDINLYSHKEPFFPDMPKNFSYSGDHAMYVISKNAAQDMLRHYYEEYGVGDFVFRLPTVYCYSPYQYYYPGGVKKMRPVYCLINKAMNAEPIQIWGDPQRKQDMLHVYDLAQMMCKAVETTKVERGIYNAGTGSPVTIDEQIRTIVDVFAKDGKKSEISYAPDMPSIYGYMMDVRNVEEELEYKYVYTCRKLFEDFKSEMQLNRFISLRGN